MKYGLSALKMTEIVGKAYVGNEASIEVLKKCNFKFKKNFMYDNSSAVLYTISNDRN